MSGMRDQFPWEWGFSEKKGGESHRLLKGRHAQLFYRTVFGGLEEYLESGLLSVVAETSW